MQYKVYRHAKYTKITAAISYPWPPLVLNWPFRELICSYLNYLGSRCFSLQINIWKVIYLKCGERYEDMIDHCSYTHNLSSCEIKPPEINSGLKGIRTHDLCDTGAVLYQLIYQALWELTTLWVRNIPLEGEECKSIYERSYIWTAEKDMKTWLIVAVKYIIFHIFICIPHFLRVYYELTMWPAPKWLDNSQLVEHCIGIAEVMGFFRL